MLRITTWRITNPRPEVTAQMALQTFQESCAALEKVPGVGRVRFFLANNSIVTVGEPENYAAADAILKSKEAQIAVAKIFALGYGIVEDQFLLEPAQAVPFTEAVQAVPAGLSRN